MIRLAPSVRRARMSLAFGTSTLACDLLLPVAAHAQCTPDPGAPDLSAWVEYKPLVPRQLRRREDPEADVQRHRTAVRYRPCSGFQHFGDSNLHC